MAWAVGAGGSIWQLDDETWTAQPSPTDQDLHALWGPAADSVWAVGAAGTALHFDGSTWTSVPTGVSVLLRDIHGTGEDDVWAVGDDGFILHWDGDRWSTVDAPSREDLWTVWASAPDQVWIGGPTGSLLEWDGGTWRLVQVSTRPLFVIDLAGVSATDLWAVAAERRDCIDYGNEDETSDGASSLILHLGEDGWREVFTLSDDGVSLKAVFALDSDDIWMVGGEGFSFHPVDPWHGAVLRWDGVRWFLEEVHGERLTAIWGISPDQLWSGSVEGVLRRGDQAWTREDGPGRVNAIWGPERPRSGCAAGCDCESLSLPDAPAIEQSPCAAVSCQGGLCDGLARDGSCACGEGFHAEGRVCVADRPCTGVTCSNIGTCVEEAGGTRCECPAGTVDQGGIACAPVPREGNCSADGWCVEQPLPIAEVTALWASGPDDVWAVGPGGDVARRTAAGWQRIDLGTSMSLIDVSGTSSDDVWIAGETAIYHWDGTSLAEVKVDCLVGAYGLQMHLYLEIEAVAPDQVWLVGERDVQNGMEPPMSVCIFDGDRWHALHEYPYIDNPWGECGWPAHCSGLQTSPGGDIWCGGSRWVGDPLVPMPAPTGLEGFLDVLWAADPDDLWGNFSSELHHWADGGWTSTGITGVKVMDGMSADDVWAVGDQVLHWDGKQWSVVDTTPVTVTYAPYSVVAGGPNEAIVSTPLSYLNSHLVHYAGTIRTVESSTLGTGWRAVWAAAADDVWIAGNNFLLDDRAAVAHWNGLTLTAVDVPGLNDVYQLLGFAADDIWAHGNHGSGEPNVNRLAHFDGAWTVTVAADLDFGSPVVERSLSWLSGTAADDVWLYGHERTSTSAEWESVLAHWNGAAWSRIAGPPGGVSAIWPSSNYLWVMHAVDMKYQSILSRWDGSTWQDFGPPIEIPLADMVGFADDDIWVAGYNGLVYHWNGASWQQVDVGSVADFKSIWGTASDDIWLSGGSSIDAHVGGVLLHFDGRKWSRQHLPTDASVDEVFGVNGEVWAVGPYVLHKR